MGHTETGNPPLPLGRDAVVSALFVGGVDDEVAVLHHELVNVPSVEFNVAPHAFHDVAQEAGRENEFGAVR